MIAFLLYLLTMGIIAVLLYFAFCEINKAFIPRSNESQDFELPNSEDEL